VWVNLLHDERIGIVACSILSAICGYFFLNRTLPRTEAPAQTSKSTAS